MPLDRSSTPRSPDETPPAETEPLLCDTPGGGGDGGDVRLVLTHTKQDPKPDPPMPTDLWAFLSATRARTLNTGGQAGGRVPALGLMSRIEAVS